MWYNSGFEWSFLWPVFWIIIWFVYLKNGHHHSRKHRDDERSSAEEILSERFAKGEINEEEYEKRLTILKRNK